MLWNLDLEGPPHRSWSPESLLCRPYDVLCMQSGLLSNTEEKCDRYSPYHYHDNSSGTEVHIHPYLDSLMREDRACIRTCNVPYGLQCCSTSVVKFFLLFLLLLNQRLDGSRSEQKVEYVDLLNQYLF